MLQTQHVKHDDDDDEEDQRVENNFVNIIILRPARFHARTLSEFWQAIICQRLRQAMAGHTLIAFSAAAAAAAAAVSSGHSIDFIVIPLLSFVIAQHGIGKPQATDE